MPQSRADRLIYAHISKLFCRAEPRKSGHRSRGALIAIPIIIVLLLGGAALGGWWLWDRRRNRGPQVRNCPALTSQLHLATPIDQPLLLSAFTRAAVTRGRCSVAREHYVGSHFPNLIHIQFHIFSSLVLCGAVVAAV